MSSALYLFLEFLADICLTMSFQENGGQLQSGFLQRGILRPHFLLHLLEFELSLLEMWKWRRITKPRNSCLKHEWCFEIMTKPICHVEVTNVKNFHKTAQNILDFHKILNNSTKIRLLVTSRFQFQVYKSDSISDILLLANFKTSWICFFAPGTSVFRAFLD